MSNNNFNDFEISVNIKKAINDMGFDEPTLIQKLIIPEALKGKDIIGQAYTGSGKTIAFAVPIVEKIFIPDKSPQAIILCPTRELCIQISEVIAKIGCNIKKLKVTPVYGGQTIGRQVRVLNKGVHIIVGTPGRIIDHMNRGTIDLFGVERVVLDEADEMLKMGFVEDIGCILSDIPYRKQTLMFSATISSQVRKLANKYQNNPKFIKTLTNNQDNPKISQYSFSTNYKTKFDDLIKLIDCYAHDSTLIFCNTKKRVNFITRQLKKIGYSVDGIHGDLNQNIRNKVMNKFRNGNIKFLVASDVAARGLDINNVSLVINYDVPYDIKYYIHRIGRTARAGNEGCAFTLVLKSELSTFNRIKKENNLKIKQKNIPKEK